MNSSFQVYIDYILLKRHFSDEKFVWNELNQYKKIKYESFLNRKDKIFFDVLFKRYKDRKNVINHLISCFLYDNNFWIGNALKEEYIDYHFSRMIKIGGLEKTFENDCEKIEEYLNDHKIYMDDLSLTFGTKPPIIIELYPSIISLETLAVFNHLTGFSNLWFPLNPLQKLRRLIIYKYSKLLNFKNYNVAKIQNTYQKLCQS